MAAIAFPQNPSRAMPTLRLVPERAEGSAARVYRRRQLVTVLVGLLLLAVVVQGAALLRSDAATTTVRTGTLTRGATGTVLVSDPAAFGAAGAELPDHAVYVVRPGDTLWSIARRVAPGADVTETVARLSELNGSSALQVGQRLRLN